jgi:hypothetical protein
MSRNNTPSVPIYRRYSFFKKISKYNTPAKVGERFVGFVDIFHTQNLIGRKRRLKVFVFPSTFTSKTKEN